MEPERNDREILRHGFRLDALDEWRRDATRDLVALRKDVNEMAKSDEFTARMAHEMGLKRAAMFSTGEKVIGGLVGFVMAACAITGVVLQITGSG